jgi:predicted NBD/HSP70 family sugar kinase
VTATSGTAASSSVDVRRGNLVRIIDDLRGQGPLSRSDLARMTGLAVPTVHRLVSELTTAGLVLEDQPAQDESRLGRPPAVYRFHGGAGYLAGLDIGNASTRVVLSSLTGQPVASVSAPTADLAGQLTVSVAGLIGSLLSEAGGTPGQLAAVGIGIASAVDPATAELRDPPVHRQWQGLVLGAELSGQLGCAVTVEQDDHLAALAETSAAGTVPGARSVVVLEVGHGIGVGAALDAVPLTGERGRFGRIGSLPVTPPRGVRMPGRTLGECLTAPGLVAQYAARGGVGAVHDGQSLFAAAREGDPHARTTVSWAAREIAAVALVLHTVLDPQGFVLGGGLAAGFDLLAPDLSRQTEGTGLVIAPSVLGDQAVLTGALLAARGSVEPWLLARLSS